MQRLAFFVACLTLVLAPGVAGAQSSPSPGQSDGAKPPAAASLEDRARLGKAANRRARSAARSAAREHRLSSLRRAKKKPTAEDELKAALDALYNGRYLRRGTTAVYVVDAATGRPLYAAHEDESLNPASNVKLISTAAALDALGPGYRYVTRVLGPSSVDGTVTGDLYLLGTYDPTLNPAHLQAMAHSLAADGVARVHGDIHVGPQRWRESLARPRIAITVQGTEPGQPPLVRVEPPNALVDVEVSAVTGERRRARPRSDIELSIHRVENQLVGNSYQLDVAGTIAPGRHATMRRWLYHGPELAAHIFRQALVDAGVEVIGAVRRSPLSEYVAASRAGLPVELARHESMAMSDIVAVINKHSVNRLADRVVMSAGAARFGGDPTMDKGVQLMQEWLHDHVGINPNRVYLDTGSGLSYNTKLTARQIVKVLRSAAGYARSSGDESNTPGEAVAALSAEQAAARVRKLSQDDVGDGPNEAAVLAAMDAAFVESLAVGGVDGTLRRRFRSGPTRGRVLGKTGTLTRVLALSGVVSVGEGNGLAFAIVSNGHDRRKRNRVRKQHEAMVKAMYAYLAARVQRDLRRAHSAR